MILPIDAREAPFREKYIDEETSMFKHWFEFGVDSADHTIQVSDNTGDILVGLTVSQAAEIVRARTVFINSVLAILNKRGR